MRMTASAIDLLSTHIFIHFCFYFAERSKTLEEENCEEKNRMKINPIERAINTWKVSAGLLTERAKL